MNLAQMVKSSWRVKGSVPASAKWHDPNVQVDTDAGIRFYIFSDRSVLAAKGRGKHLQLWAPSTLARTA